MRLARALHVVAALPSCHCCVCRHLATGKAVPWRIFLGDDGIEQPVAPAPCTHEQFVELQEMLARHVLGHLAGVTAAPFIRSPQRIPLRVEHVPDRASQFVCFSGRSWQRPRVLAFIDLAVKRQTNNAGYMLSARELSSGQRRLWCS